MRTISKRLIDLVNSEIPLGFVGENEHTQIRLDSKRVFDEYPNAVPSLTVRPPQGSTYPAVVTRDGDVVVWNVKDSDLVYQGHGEIQLAFIEDGVKVRSYVGKTYIDRSLQPTGNAPTPIENWIEEANEIIGGIPNEINEALADAKASGEFDGPQGPEGPEGPEGPAGKDGADGTPGKDGADGAPGKDGKDGADGARGADGVTFTPSVSEQGVISWSNDGGRQNPASVNIKGPQGQTGPAGQDGTDATPDLICKPYSELTFPVSQGTLCFHGEALYKAKVDIQTAEDWTAEHWDETTVGEILWDVNSALSAKQDAPETIGTAGQVLGLDSNLDPVWVDQTGGGSVDPQDIAEAVDAWCDENITNPSSPPLDRSLTSSSAAAPADIVGEMNVDLEEDTKAVEDLKQVKEIVFTNGYYIPNTGATHSPTNLTANDSRRCAVVDCKGGDIFTISGESNSTMFNVFSVVDAENNALVRAGNRTTIENVLINIPQGGVKLILNSTIANTGKCYYGEKIPASYYADMKRIIDPDEIINGYANCDNYHISYNSGAKYLNTQPHFAKKGSRLRITQGTNCYTFGLVVKDTKSTTVFFNNRTISFDDSGVKEYVFGQDSLYVVDFQNSGKTNIDPSDYDATVEYVFGHSMDYENLADTINAYQGHTNTGWKQGRYDIKTGSFESDTLWGCTSFYIDDDIVSIKVPSNMRMAAHLFDCNIDYLGIFNSGAGATAKSTATNSMLSSEINIEDVKKSYPNVAHFMLSATYAANIDNDESTESVTVDPETLPNLVTFTRRSMAHDNCQEVPKEYNAELIKTVNAVKEYQTEPNVVFLRFTDAHIFASGNNKQLDSFFKLPNVLSYLKKELPIVFIADTGDDVNGTVSTDAEIAMEKARIDALNRAVISTGIPFCKVPGNHDPMSNFVLKYPGMFRYFASTAQSVYRNPNTNGTDYYFDDPQNKIRFIFLNTTDESHQYAWNTNMVTWLENDALATPEGYQVILFGHIDPLEEHNNTSAGYSGSTSVVSLLENYESGTKHIMAFVYGHSHRDGLFATKYAAIASSCAKAETQTYGRVDAYWDRPERVLGEASEQCLDVFVVKPISHKIHVVRFGAGADRTVHYVTNALAVAGTLTLTPEIVPSSWEAQNTAVATVSNGVVTGVAAGTTGIKAYDSTGNVEYWRVTVS